MIDDMKLLYLRDLFSTLPANVTRGLQIVLDTDMADRLVAFVEAMDHLMEEKELSLDSIGDYLKELHSNRKLKLNHDQIYALGGAEIAIVLEGCAMLKEVYNGQQSLELHGILMAGMLGMKRRLLQGFTRAVDKMVSRDIPSETPLERLQGMYEVSMEFSVAHHLCSQRLGEADLVLSLSFLVLTFLISLWLFAGQGGAIGATIATVAAFVNICKRTLRLDKATFVHLDYSTQFKQIAYDIEYSIMNSNFADQALEVELLQKSLAVLRSKAPILPPGPSLNYLFRYGKNAEKFAVINHDAKWVDNLANLLPNEYDWLKGPILELLKPFEGYITDMHNWVDKKIARVGDATWNQSRRKADNQAETSLDSTANSCIWKIFSNCCNSKVEKIATKEGSVADGNISGVKSSDNVSANGKSEKSERYQKSLDGYDKLRNQTSASIKKIDKLDLCNRYDELRNQTTAAIMSMAPLPRDLPSYYNNIGPDQDLIDAHNIDLHDFKCTFSKRRITELYKLYRQAAELKTIHHTQAYSKRGRLKYWQHKCLILSFAVALLVLLPTTVPYVNFFTGAFAATIALLISYTKLMRFENDAAHHETSSLKFAALATSIETIFVELGDILEGVEAAALLDYLDEESEKQYDQLTEIGQKHSESRGPNSPR